MNKIPKLYSKANDGSILKTTEIFVKDSPTTVQKVTDGYTKTDSGVKTFFETQGEPLYIELTAEYPTTDELEIQLEFPVGHPTNTANISVDYGDGVFVDYIEINSLFISGNKILGTNMVIKSNDDIYGIRIIEHEDKWGEYE